MKFHSKVFYKSFFISMAVFAIIATIIVASFYSEAIAIEPTQRESNVLMGISHGGKIISLLVLNCNPKSNTIAFLPIPDNTLLSDGDVLQNQYSPTRIKNMVNSVEELIGARINRYIIFSTDALAAITNSVGKFDYLIPYKFIYNNYEHSGPSYMDGELSKAMFTYTGYDMTKVSISEIGNSYLHSFLSKHATPNGSLKLAEAINSKDVRKLMQTNISQDEMDEYCKFLSNYSSLTHKPVELDGNTHLTSSKLYFTPTTFKSDKNIFK